MWPKYFFYFVLHLSAAFSECLCLNQVHVKKSKNNNSAALLKLTIDYYPVRTITMDFRFNLLFIYCFLQLQAS